MNKKFYVLLMGACVFATIATAQNIPYGSNNGKYISIRNTKIYYEEYGKGIPIVLLHGGMGSIADFKRCIPDLSKHFRVIAPDSPGQGRSGLADSMSYQLMADYMSNLIDALKLDSAFVIGWSDGGNTGLILAKIRPDKVKKVIAAGANYKLSGFPILANDPDLHEPLPSDFEEKNRKWLDEYNKPMKRDGIKMLNDLKKMYAQEIFFPRSILEGINIPVMLVLGDKDEVTLEHGLEMYRMIRGSQFCILPNTSHAVLQERPGQINQLAIEFFGQK
jgi:pimeloyl-ACP methyl ester carboxylesterase